jgi:hypothetical protein
MRAADIPHWDGVSGRLKAFAQITQSVAEWLDENTLDVRVTVADAGDAADGDDWLKVTLSQGDETAGGEFKVGTAPDGLPER